MKLSPWVWVFALIISCSLCFGQVQYGKDFEDMSQTEKMMMYNSHKKTPMTGVLYSWLFPSLGHAYGNNWKRGTYFLAGISASIGIGIFLAEYYDCNSGRSDHSSGFCEDENGLIIINKKSRPYYNIGMSMIVIVAPIISILEKVDAYKEVKRYNRRIYKEIFGKEPPSFSLNLQPTYQGANLTLAYKFD